MTTISWRRRLVALLLLPFMMLLAGCGKLHADFDIQDAETINLSFDFSIDEEYIGTTFTSADEMCSSFSSEMDLVGESAPTVEPYEEDGAYGCRVAGVLTSEDFDSDLNLVEEDGEYRLTISGDDASVDGVGSSEMAQLDIDFRMTFTFPGEIIESSGGQIDGNTVTFTDINEITSGIDIRAEANGFPWVIVIIAVLVVGFLLLLVVAAIIFFVVRSRKNKGGGTPTPGGYGSPAASPSPQWGQSSPPAAPQAPQQGGQQWGQASPPAAPQPPQPGSQQWDGQGQQQPPWAHPGDQPGGQQNPGGPQGPQQSGW